MTPTMMPTQALSRMLRRLWRSMLAGVGRGPARRAGMGRLAFCCSPVGTFAYARSASRRSTRVLCATPPRTASSEYLYRKHITATDTFFSVPLLSSLTDVVILAHRFLTVNRRIDLLSKYFTSFKALTWCC